MRPAITSTIESTLTALTSSPESDTEASNLRRITIDLAPFLTICMYCSSVLMLKQPSPWFPSFELMATLPMTTFSLFPRALEA